MYIYMYICIHVSVISQDGYSALIWAARDGHTEVVVELVMARANLDLQNIIVMCTMNKHTHTLSCSEHCTIVHSH